MKKILFPTDFSNASKIALDYAVQFALNIGAKIDVMTIYNLPVDITGSAFPHTIEPLIAEKKQEAEEHLKKVTSSYPTEVIGHLFAEYGIFIYQEVVDFSEKGNYDMILMGTRGETQGLDKILGNVTSHTMMQAKCPVLAIPPDCSFRPIQKIAFATDFVSPDKKALDDLNKIGSFLGASIHVVHISTQTEKENSGTSEDITIVQSDSIQHGIEKFIEEKNIDVLSLFIPKRRIWERLFHSSFSKKMTLQSKIPLLTFRQ